MSNKRFLCDSENGVEVVTRPAEVGFVTTVYSHATIDGLLGEFSTADDYRGQHKKACDFAGIRARSLEKPRKPAYI